MFLYNRINKRIYFIFLLPLLLFGIHLSKNPHLLQKKSVLAASTPFLKLFGQKSFTETARDTITGHGIYHAAGVVVDKSVAPNRVYIADTGNSRILGYKSLGTCSTNPDISCTNDIDCQSDGSTPTTIQLTTPGSCNTEEDICWKALTPLSGFNNAYLLRPNGRAEFQDITIIDNMILEMSYYDSNHSYGNGFYVKVAIIIDGNESIIWTSPLVASPDHETPKFISLPLDQYAGQIVTIAIITDKNGGSGENWGDEATIADPIITNQKLNKCIINPDKDADIVIGQPDFESGACNRDNLQGIYKNPANTSLCLMTYPLSTNTAENWGRLNFDVDTEGNLYVPDIYNNRILIYNQPFAKSTPANISADYVIGQPNFLENQINHGLGINTRDASSLYIGIDPADGKFGVMARGTSVDPQGNIWVADTYNSRIMRFPKKAGGGYEQQADLVIGQSDFTSSFRSNCNKQVSELNLSKICAPILARIDPESGELYVLDQINPPGQYFYTIILVYTPQQGVFVNGQPANRIITVNQPLPFDPWNGWSVEYMPQFTSFQFNNTSVTEYANGKLWLMENEAKRILLINNIGDIITTINAPNTPAPAPHDGELKYRRGGEYFFCNQDPTSIAYQRFCPSWPGGSFDFDNADNIYFADEFFHRIIRHSLPYQIESINGAYYLPRPNSGLFSNGQPNTVSAYHITESGGTVAINGQLIVKDRNRYLVWNNYLSRQLGEKADYVIGQSSETERLPNSLARHAYHAIDDQNRMWTYDTYGKLMIYQLPFTGNNPPIATNIPLYWIDSPSTLVDYGGNTGIAFDQIHKALFINDKKNNRILRIANYSDFNNKLLVDMVIGQPDLLNTKCNHDQDEAWTAPGPAKANGLCGATDIEIDNLGNLYAVENSYEGHGNIRVSVWMADDIANAVTNGVLFPNISAKKVFTQDSLTSNAINHFEYTDRPFSPVSVAFNSRNQMVLANDGYYQNRAMHKDRHLRQLWLYHDPLKKDSTGNFIMNQPADAYINLPIGAPAEISFDNNDNLIVHDSTWERINIINFETDPSMIKCLKTGDVDCSGIIDLNDLNILITALGTSKFSSDLNNSGIVNVLDLSILLSNY